MSCANGPADSDSVNLGSNPSSPAIDLLRFFDFSIKNRIEPPTALLY